MLTFLCILNNEHALNTISWKNLKFANFGFIKAPRELISFWRASWAKKVWEPLVYSMGSQTRGRDPKWGRSDNWVGSQRGHRIGGVGGSLRYRKGWMNKTSKIWQTMLNLFVCTLSYHKTGLWTSLYVNAIKNVGAYFGTTVWLFTMKSLVVDLQIWIIYMHSAVKIICYQ